jgi:hypothetical protein
MHKLIRTTVLIFYYVFSLNSAQAKERVMATAHWPPWVTIEDKHKFSGINIAPARALAKELDLGLVLITCL